VNANNENGTENRLALEGTATGAFSAHVALEEDPSVADPSGENCGTSRNCHQCSSKAECALTGNHSVVVVKVDRKYMCSTYGVECDRGTVSNPKQHAYEEHEIDELKDAFHCERHCDDGTGSLVSLIHHREFGSGHTSGTKQLLAKENTAACQKCACHCSKHPPCEGKLNAELVNTMLVGNHWPNVATRQECCNLCTNNPSCDSFTYTPSKACKLYQGAPVFRPADDAATFSGCTFGAACNLANAWTQEQQNAHSAMVAKDTARFSTAKTAQDDRMVADWQATVSSVDPSIDRDATKYGTDVPTDNQNTDGEVKFEEDYKGQVTKSGASTAENQQRDDAFDHYDTNNDQVVTASEIREHMAAEHSKSPF